MPLSRRSFVQALGLGTVAAAAYGPSRVLAARGREALAELPPWERDRALALSANGSAIRLNSNENPIGPGPAAIDAIRSALSEANRYPFASETDVTAAIARARGVPVDHVLIGCGSTEVLKMAVTACVSPTRALVTASPTFEDPGYNARAMGAPVIEVPVDRDLRLDLDAMRDRATNAGLIFFCNPNNPTATVHGAPAVSAFVSAVNRISPKTTILIDEAYHEYVDDPAYQTAIPLALENPRVIVSRTFSKVFGMAGLRIGYAIGRPEALDALKKHRLDVGVNVLAAAAAMGSLADADHIAAERSRNREVRRFTRGAIVKLGYPVPVSNTNFVMFDVRRKVTDVIDGCRKEGVLIGRPFPPLDTHARISIGTMDEMRTCVDVLGRVLGRTTSHG
ncbi:MAG TPA: aminotransferase class I/II-fold pyridoxal phosphate-dependent enzyme [Vicinamibacterales bacterium]|jgi:histidinol-phosphate aminotransferase|nr:aminotransferase class I/II-fold pyridoxal phosphate-dependent enzyme [Vicinamibacterales bacterium]